MSQKSAIKRTLPRKDKKAAKTVKSPEVVEELPEEISVLDKIKPHLATLGLMAVAGVLAFAAVAMWRSSSFSNEAIKWVELNQAKAINSATGDVKDLVRVAEDYEDNVAGLVGAMYAGDSQMRSGILQLSTDREGGLSLVGKAKVNFESVVNAPEGLKSAWLNERSQYQMAYACETLGEFAEARKHYKNLVESAPNSPLFEKATRGLGRTSNDQYVALYQEFKDFEATLGDAPGPTGGDPSRPSDALNAFDGIDIAPGEAPPAVSPLDKKDEPKMEEPNTEEASPAKSGDDASAEEKADPTKADPTKTDPTKTDSEAKGEATPEAKKEEGKPDENAAVETDAKKSGEGETPAAKTETPAKESSEASGGSGSSEGSEG